VKRFVGLALAIFAMAAVTLAGTASFPWDKLFVR
jgi:hypothetical protein